MKREGLLIAWAFVEMAIVGVLWTVALTALARGLECDHETSGASRCLLKSVTIVVLGPAVGIGLGLAVAWLLKASAIGLGVAVVFGATLGLSAALLCARNLVSRTWRPDDAMASVRFQTGAIRKG